MAWASFANLIPQLPDFFGKGVDYAIGSLGGMPDSKSRKNQIHDIRTLRRREYQDMVHSLKEAGLNPILATGASPGHASAQMLAPNLGSQSSGGNVGSAYAAHRQAGVAEAKAPSEIDSTKTNTANAMIGRAGLLQQYEMNQLEMDSKRQNTETAYLLGEVYKQDAIGKGASAREIEQRMEQIEKFGLPGQSAAGFMRQLFTDPANQSTAKGWYQSTREAAEAYGRNHHLKNVDLGEYWDWGRDTFNQLRNARK